MVRCRVLAVAVLALTLAGCGTLRAGTGAGGAPSVSASPTSTIWGSFGPSGSQVVSVRLDDSGHVLAITVQVPSGRNGCMRDLTTSLVEFSSTTADVTVEYRGPATGPLAGHCPPDQVKTVNLTLPAPLGKRDLVINSTGTFAPAHGTLLRRCSDDGGACTFPPVPPASCSEASYGYAMLSTAPAAHAVYSELGCDGHWLVLNVGWPGGAVGCDGRSCSPHLTATHWFFRAGPHGWVTIASSLTAGCTRVHQVEPRFPTHLCSGLPAVGPYAAAPSTGASHLSRAMSALVAPAVAPDTTADP